MTIIERLSNIRMATTDEAANLIKELEKDRERLERIKPFIKEWTLKIQKHRELKPEQLDYIFQSLYHWYCELDVENLQAIDTATKGEKK